MLHVVRLRKDIREIKKYIPPAIPLIAESSPTPNLGKVTNHGKKTN
jgi:hypothetical protein